MEIFIFAVLFCQVFGLFKGMAPPLAAVALQNAILFGVYGNVLSLLATKPDQKPSLSHIYVAAAASGVAQLWVVCPMELVKIKLQMQREGKYRICQSAKTPQLWPMASLHRVFHVTSRRPCWCP